MNNEPFGEWEALSRHRKAKPGVTEDKVKDLFAKMKRLDRGRTLKAAFDYSNHDPLFLKILFWMTFVFMGGVSAVFVSDGLNHMHCNPLLFDPASSKIVNADILKIKKNRRGNLVWDLKFTTESGQLITGKREAVNPDAAITEPGKAESTATVIYAPESLKCWDVSTKPNVHSPAIAQRNFTMGFTLGFGIFFGLAWLFLCTWLWRIINRHRPYETWVASLKLI